MIKVLLVDDEPALLEITELYLESRNDLDVDTAPSAREAMEKRKVGEYDAIVSDYQMPGMDGIEFLRAIRESGDEIPFILFTGRGREEVVIEALNIGADFYLMKGGEAKAQFAELHNMIIKVVQGKKTKEEKERLFHELSDLYKELELLYTISKISTVVGKSLEDILQETVDLVPPAWHHPETTCSRIVIEGKEFRTNNFKETEWKQSEDIEVKGTIVGAVEVYYLEKKPELDEGPFLNDERQLIEALGRLLENITDRKMNERKIEHLNKVLRSIRNVNQLITMETDKGKLIQRSGDILIEDRGYFNAWLALFDEGRCISSANSWFDGRFDPIRETLERGSVTSCGKKAMERSEIVVTENPMEECVDCPLHTVCNDLSTFTIRLAHMDRTYGLLSASIPADLAGDLEERGLFEEVAGDIGFALYKIEMEGERERAEKELRIANKQLLDTIDFLPDATFVIDKDGKVTAWNRAIERMTGIPKDEMVGQGDFAYAVPFYGERRKIMIDLILSQKEDIESIYDHVRREGGTLFGETFVHSLRDGTGTHLWGTASPLYDEDGEIIGAIESIRDVTKQRRAEEELRKGEERYRTLIDDVIDDMDVGVFILDSEFKVAWINNTMEQYFGLDRNEIVGKDKRQLIRGRISGIFEDPDEFMDKVLATYDDNTYVENFECHVLPDGGREERYLVHKSQPISVGPLSGGRIENYYDITKRKQMERAMTIANRKLNLLGSITRHDVINQLTVINGYCEIIERSLTDPRLIEHVRKIDNSRESIEKQMDFSRECETLGGMGLKWISVNDITDKWASYADEENVSLQVNVDNIEILADPLMEKVFYNLIDNAIKHGGDVSRVLVRYEITDRGLTIVFEDDGVGVPPDLKERIFDLGYGKSTGLGLFISREILSMMGMTIEEMGKEREGARVDIGIPAPNYRFPSE